MISPRAGRDLLVSGVAVLNIILVSVTEWTTEIGVRMVVGAGLGIIVGEVLLRALTLAIARERQRAGPPNRLRPERDTGWLAVSNPASFTGAGNDP